MGKVVLFTGAPKTGSTFLAKYAAKIISKDNKRIAVVDISKNKGIYHNICFGRDQDTIGLLELLNGNGNKRALPYGENIDIFTVTSKVILDLVPSVLLKRVEEIREEYDLVIIDSDLETSKSLISCSVKTIDELYLIQDLHEENAAQMEIFLNKIKDRLKENEINATIVCNKSIYCKVKFEYFEKYFNTLGEVKAVLIPFEERNMIVDLNNKSTGHIKTNKFTNNLKKALYGLCSNITNVNSKVKNIV
ncbi:hypothetical protein [Sporosalibacterium faouarense]|uniref:hypothetical protein n=1 Tax=Sporosalibacterium faouarense TaxID=516123 RepID=UPI00192ADD40|nr:hypothetical protein [Sporosalibacterium faouarense]